MLLGTVVRLLIYKTGISITLSKRKGIRGVIIRVILPTLVSALVLTLLAVIIVALIHKEYLSSWWVFGLIYDNYRV
jgi:hypothetical protein